MVDAAGLEPCGPRNAAANGLDLGPATMGLRAQ
jgi:hypothetical protein